MMKKRTGLDCFVILMGFNYWLCDCRLAGLVLLMTYGIIHLIHSWDKHVEILFCAMLQFTTFCLLSLFLKDQLLVSSLLIYLVFVCLILACKTVQLYNQEISFSYIKLKKQMFLRFLGILIFLLMPKSMLITLGYPLLQKLSGYQIILYAMVYHAPFLITVFLVTLKEALHPLQTLQIVSTSFKNVVK